MRKLLNSRILLLVCLLVTGCGNLYSDDSSSESGEMPCDYKIEVSEGKSTLPIKGQCFNLGLQTWSAMPSFTFNGPLGTMDKNYQVEYSINLTFSQRMKTGSYSVRIPDDISKTSPGYQDKFGENEVLAFIDYNFEKGEKLGQSDVDYRAVSGVVTVSAFQSFKKEDSMFDDNLLKFDFILVVEKVENGKLAGERATVKSVQTIVIDTRED